MAALPVRVLKFGGTSVQDADRIRHVVSLSVDGSEGFQNIVVVSALGGVTNRLIDGINEAMSRSGRHEETLKEIKGRHDEALEALVKPSERQNIAVSLDAVWKRLSELLDGVFLLRECTPRTWDAIISTGERASVPLIAGAFRSAGYPAAALDASTFIRTDDTFTEAVVDFPATQKLVRETFGNMPVEFFSVVTGFIASTEGGVITTLGRSGSDYTATIIAGALDATEVVIWTDVDGVLSADPRLVKDAFSLERLNYWEAGELAYFGAKVLHPRTMRPLQQRGIPLLIKNTLNSSAPGTLISSETSHLDGHVKAVTSIKEMAVVTLEGSGIMGVPGVAARALTALAAKRINVLMISQASSEQSICFVVSGAERFIAARFLEQAFELERQRGDVSGVTVQDKVAVVAVVGENMRNRPGIAGRLFSTLGRGNINVLAIAQGSSERNISVAISQADVKRTVRALHDAFPLALNRANLFVFGPGNVGSALLRMVDRHAAELSQRSRLDLRVIGCANSRRFIWDDDGIPMEGIHEALARGPEASSSELIDRLKASHHERLVVIDTTASDVLADHYADLLDAGIAVVTANKLANTRPQAYYDQLHRNSKRRNVPYLYETTVGAGLPVMSTFREMVRTGDRIERLDAVVSGTLAFLFNRLMEGGTFSDTLREAHRLGYTEPDPREDLSGADVIRKMIILARETGAQLEMDDVHMEALLPEAYRSIEKDAFMERLSELDEAWSARVASFREQGQRMHFAGTLAEGKVNVGIKGFAAGSPFGSLTGTDNLIAIQSSRYHDSPLIIRGPGAGPDVTAGGLFGDIIRAAELLL